MKSLFAYPRLLFSPAGVFRLAMILSMIGTIGADNALAIQVPAGSNTRNAVPSVDQNQIAGQPSKVFKTDQQWRQQLSELEFNVTRKKGTEQAYSGKYWDHKEQGVYTCKCCGQPLFDSKTKFKSGTGWPSYYKPLNKTAVNNLIDRSAGMVRTEVTCSRCDAHLGHVFKDGPQPTGLRYCLNSVSLGFDAKEKMAADRKQGEAQDTVYGHASAQKLVEALMMASVEKSNDQFLKCTCWDRLPDSIKSKLKSSTKPLIKPQVRSMTIRPAQSVPSFEDSEYNVNYLGNIEVQFADGGQPVVLPFGEVAGRYYLATKVAKGSFPAVPRTRQLREFESSQGSGSR